MTRLKPSSLSSAETVPRICFKTLNTKLLCSSIRPPPWQFFCDRTSDEHDGPSRSLAARRSIQIRAYDLVLAACLNERHAWFHRPHECVAPQPCFSEWRPLCLLSLAILPGSEARPQSYAVWAADSAIARGQGNGLGSTGAPVNSYEHGEFQWGLRLLYEQTGNKTYFNYIQAGVDKIVSSNGTIGGGYSFSAFVQDYIRTGPSFIYLFQQTGLAKYKTAAATYRSQLNGQPRTAQGQFWHKLVYFNQGWLDGIYMGEVFYTAYTKAFDANNATAWADITSQFKLMFDNTLQNSTAPNNTGLLYHGYDFSHTAVWASPDRGHSPEVWDRALGWYAMALVDVLELAPPNSGALKPTLLNILNVLAPNIRDAADPTSGVWWLVITQPGRALNYFESSGTVMFIYSFLKAVRLGYVEDADGSIVAAMKKAYNYVVANWVVPKSDGTMDWKNTVSVGSLGGAGDYNYYVSQTVPLNDLKGLGAFLLASLEFEKLK